MKELKKSIFLMMITFTFWGVLYPQFSLVEEAYECVEEKNPKEDFIAILNAEAGELRFRCKLWELWKEGGIKRNEKEWS